MVEIVIIYIIFFVVKYLSFKVTTDWFNIIPTFLREYPYICGDCLQTHVLWQSYLILSFLLDWNLIILIGGLGLTLLNTLAIFYNNKQREK